MSTSSPHVDVIVAEAKSHDDGDVAVIATDLAGTIVYWGDGAATLYGWPAEDALGKNVLDVTPTYSSSDEAARIMEQLRRGEPWAGEFIVRRRDGRPILAHVTDLPVRAGAELVGIVGLSRAERHPPTTDRSTP